MGQYLTEIQLFKTLESEGAKNIYSAQHKGVHPL